MRRIYSNSLNSKASLWEFTMVKYVSVIFLNKSAEAFDILSVASHVFTKKEYIGKNATYSETLRKLYLLQNTVRPTISCLHWVDCRKWVTTPPRWIQNFSKLNLPSLKVEYKVVSGWQFCKYDLKFWCGVMALGIDTSTGKLFPTDHMHLIQEVSAKTST